MSNPNDQIRRQMLQYFYDRNKYATSKQGKNGSQVRISDVKKELKQMHGLTQQDVISQLRYLISNEWVEEIVKERTFTTPRGTQQPSIQEWYAITAKGMDRFEGSSSEFKRESPYSNINITAVHSAVQLGDGNVVQESFLGLANELEQLRRTVDESDLSDDEKMSAIAEIETINSQLAKPEPNKPIIKLALDGLTSGKAAHLVQYIGKLSRFVEGIGL